MDGIINVYKEAGFTSFDVVAKLRGILKQKKIGHTGTLDPNAEGVLPVCVGKATKICEYLTEKDKIYETVLHLGITTDTEDMSGTVLTETAPNISEERLKEIIVGFIGKQKQIPPMYSALKVNGKKLCDLARQGIEVERKAREIEIFDISIEEIRLPFVKMQVHCSKGTYIRTLCKDIGEAAGCGGCMESLLRTKTAGFTLDTAYKLSEIEAIVKGTDEKGRTVNDLFLSVDEVLNAYPKAVAVKEADKLLQNGNRISTRFLQEKPSASDLSETQTFVRMYDAQKNFIGIFSYDSKRGDYKPEKMFI